MNFLGTMTARDAINVIDTFLSRSTADSDDNLVVDRASPTLGITVVFNAANNLFVIPLNTYNQLNEAANVVGSAVAFQAPSGALQARLTKAGLGSAANLGLLSTFRASMTVLRDQLVALQSSTMIDLDVTPPMSFGKKIAIAAGLILVLGAGAGAYFWAREPSA